VQGRVEKRTVRDISVYARHQATPFHNADDDSMYLKTIMCHFNPAIQHCLRDLLYQKYIGDSPLFMVDHRIFATISVAGILNLQHGWSYWLVIVLHHHTATTAFLYITWTWT